MLLEVLCIYSVLVSFIEVTVEKVLEGVLLHQLEHVGLRFGEERFRGIHQIAEDLLLLLPADVHLLARAVDDILGADLSSLQLHVVLARDVRKVLRFEPEQDVLVAVLMDTELLKVRAARGRRQEIPQACHRSRLCSRRVTYRPEGEGRHRDGLRSSLGQLVTDLHEGCSLGELGIHHSVQELVDLPLHLLEGLRRGVLEMGLHRLQRALGYLYLGHRLLAEPLVVLHLQVEEQGRAAELAVQEVLEGVGGLMVAEQLDERHGRRRVMLLAADGRRLALVEASQVAGSGPSHRGAAVLLGSAEGREVVAEQPLEDPVLGLVEHALVAEVDARKHLQAEVCGDGQLQARTTLHELVEDLQRVALDVRSLGGRYALEVLHVQPEQNELLQASRAQEALEHLEAHRVLPIQERLELCVKVTVVGHGRDAAAGHCGVGALGLAHGVFRRGGQEVDGRPGGRSGRPSLLSLSGRQVLHVLGAAQEVGKGVHEHTPEHQALRVLEETGPNLRRVVQLLRQLAAYVVRQVDARRRADAQVVLVDLVCAHVEVVHAALGQVLLVRIQHGLEHETEVQRVPVEQKQALVPALRQETPPLLRVRHIVQHFLQARGLLQQRGVQAVLGLAFAEVREHLHLEEVEGLLLHALEDGGLCVASAGTEHRVLDLVHQDG
eukprot:scaffold2044_cov247-Pinguiococcus_pyrenoidosus.AAC.4